MSGNGLPWPMARRKLLLACYEVPGFGGASTSAYDLCRMLREDGFDVELLMLAERRGYRVVEVAVNWADQPGSKVAVLREGPRMIYEVLAARRHSEIHISPAQALEFGLVQAVREFTLPGGQQIVQI